MLHSCTPNANKEAVLQAFKEPDSDLRVLVQPLPLAWVLIVKECIERFILGHLKMWRHISRRQDELAGMANKVWLTLFTKGYFSTQGGGGGYSGLNGGSDGA